MKRIFCVLTLITDLDDLVRRRLMISNKRGKEVDLLGLPDWLNASLA